MFLALLAFFGALAVLVLAHEFGHFLVAKKYGVKVEEFGFGFPPKIFSFRKGETLYSLNLLPLGGFVKILGENSSDSSDPGNFSSRPAFQKAIMLSAGVFFNFILAVILFSLVAWWGMPVDADDPLWQGRVQNAQITVVGVIKDSSAEKSGIKLNDKILGFGEIAQVQELIKNNLGKEITLSIERKNKKFSLKAVLPQSEIEDGAVLGIAMAKIGLVREPWYKAPFAGLKTSFLTLWHALSGLWFLLTLLFSGQSLSGFVSGPVGIFSLVDDTLDFGAVFLISLVASLSINLAVINLLPIPALDGGRLVFLLIEKFRGRPINQKASGLAHAAGFAILIILMALVTYYDVKIRL